jgi:hypothetical protein
LTTRRQLIAAGLAAAVGLRPAAARAATADAGLLELLSAFQDAVVFSYEVALRSAPLQSADRGRLIPLRDEAASEAEQLLQAVRSAGGKPPPRRALALAKLPPEIARRATRDDYLRDVARREEVATSGWYAALRQLADPRLQSGAAAFMAAGGRRLVVLRWMVRDALVPRAFETGGN